MTEREPWTAEVLIGSVLRHLSKYDIILMLRAVWELPVIHYQLFEIPIDILRLIEFAKPQPTGWRTGRQSLGANVLRGDEVVFNVFFAASDGKCRISRLRARNCPLLATWDLPVQD